MLILRSLINDVVFDEVLCVEEFEVDVLCSFAGALSCILFIISLQIAPFVPKHSASCANMSSDSMDIYPMQSHSSTCTYGYLCEGTCKPKSLIPRLELGCFSLSNPPAKQNSVQKDFTSGLRSGESYSGSSLRLLLCRGLASLIGRLHSQFGIHLEIDSCFVCSRQAIFAC